MLGLLACFFVIQATESRDDIERILGFLERQPKIVHATGTFFDPRRGESLSKYQFVYKRDRDELCFIRTYSPTFRSISLVKDGSLHSSVENKDRGRRVSYHQGKLPSHKYESYEKAFMGGAMICSDLTQIDTGFFAKTDLALLPSGLTVGLTSFSPT